MFIDNILNFITDTNKRLSTRATIFILSVIATLIIDNIVGFSYHYNNKQKLEQLKLTYELLERKNLTDKTMKELKFLESETLDRKNILDHTLSFLKKYFF